MYDLMGTIKNQANANATLSARVNSDVWFDTAPPGTTMPYVVYYNIADAPVRCLAKSADMVEANIQFSIFDKNSHSLVELIASDLAVVFDRKTVLYSTETHISCEAMGGTGPTRLDDCWMRTIDYLFRYQE